MICPQSLYQSIWLSRLSDTTGGFRCVAAWDPSSVALKLSGPSPHNLRSVAAVAASVAAFVAAAACIGVCSTSAFCILTASTSQQGKLRGRQCLHCCGSFGSAAQPFSPDLSKGGAIRLVQRPAVVWAGS